MYHNREQDNRIIQKAVHHGLEIDETKKKNSTSAFNLWRSDRSIELKKFHKKDAQLAGEWQKIGDDLKEYY